MPKLIKNITVDYQETLKDDISLTNKIETQFQDGDYQNVFGFFAFVQDYTNIETTEDLPKPPNFGLPTNNNKEFIVLEISYA